jgi:hypothetical protein
MNGVEKEGWEVFMGVFLELKRGEELKEMGKKRGDYSRTKNLKKVEIEA